NRPLAGLTNQKCNVAQPACVLQNRRCSRKGHLPIISLENQSIAFALTFIPHRRRQFLSSILLICSGRDSCCRHERQGIVRRSAGNSRPVRDGHLSRNPSLSLNQRGRQSRTQPPTQFRE